MQTSYWLSLSGGKDSYYLFEYLIACKKYRLDGVVHFELEIDFPFIKDVVDDVERKCRLFGIEFVRVRPSKTWEELYRVNGFPTRKCRWCNSKYKLDCRKQFSEMMTKRGLSVVYYIGYCFDEISRYSKRHRDDELYPLVYDCVYEREILLWAKDLPVYNDYYKYNKRCGCMYCPMSSYSAFAYLWKYYPENYTYMLEKMRETELLREFELGRPFSCIQSNPIYNSVYLDKIVRTKWSKIYEQVK